MLLHYLGKLKIQIFRKYSADMEENANVIVIVTNNAQTMTQSIDIMLAFRGGPMEGL